MPFHTCHSLIHALPCCPAILVAPFVTQIHVLNGEKYREVCPDNTLLNTMQLRSCILAPQQKKPLLKREGGLNVTEDGRILMVPEVRGWRLGAAVGCAREAYV